MRQCLIYTTTFCAAHQLAEAVVGKGHPCTRMHGYSYQLRIEVAETTPPRIDGMIIGADYLREMVDRQIVGLLDHRLLNDTVENPTIERVGAWIFETLQGILGSALSAIELQQVGGLGWRGES